MREKRKDPKHPSKKTAVVLFVAAGLAAGFLAGYMIKSRPEVVGSKSLREDTDQYKFIHPLLAVDRTDAGTPSPQYAALQKEVNAYINTQKNSGALTDASVYFINYGKSGSFALNQDEGYDPASMLKVVIMVGYLKESDTDPSILNQQFVYEPSIAQLLEAVPFEDPTKMTVGGTYVVSDLINKMIIDSDNGAMNLLLAHIDNAYLTSVYTELGLKAPEAGQPFTISSAEYSLFFRILYNGTYLSDASSEKALSILSQATFANGLVAGVPAGTVVAHKFGEHITGSGDTIQSVELHDCGIVYTNGGPYLLCVMTRGKSLDQLQTTIAAISKMVYQQVSS